MTPSRLSRAALSAGALVPLLYFGAQLVRGPFVDGYSLRRDAASDLGAEGVPGASWFNLMAIASGVAAIVAAIGWWGRLRSWGVGRYVRGALVVSLVSIGVAGLSAGLFPLPDERHGGGPLGIGLFLFPALLMLATWRSRSRRRISTWVRYYAAANLMLFGATALMFSGLTWVDERTNQGILQRLLAMTVFLPIGVVSVAFSRDRDVPLAGRLTAPAAP